jgi:hypothetical protein
MRYFILLLPFLCSTSFIHGQKEIGLLGVHFQVGVPQGEYAEAYDQIGYGGDMDLYFRLSPNLPVYAGLNVSLLGLEQFRRDFDVPLPGGFSQDYRLRVGSNIFSGYAGLRLMPNEGTMRPYAEGLIGFKNFYRSKRLQQQPVNSNEWQEVDQETEGEWTLGYGGSAGLLFFFNSWFALDLKCSYLIGNEVRFYKMKDIVDVEAFEDDPFSVFDPVRATTNMLIPQIGVVFKMSDVAPEEEVSVIDFAR